MIINNINIQGNYLVITEIDRGATEIKDGDTFESIHHFIELSGEDI